MEMQHHSPSLIYPLVSMISTILAWAFKDIQLYLNIMASIIAIISGILAIRYYWVSTNKIKKNKN